VHNLQLHSNFKAGGFHLHFKSGQFYFKPANLGAKRKLPVALHVLPLIFEKWFFDISAVMDNFLDSD